MQLPAAKLQGTTVIELLLKNMWLPHKIQVSLAKTTWPLAKQPKYAKYTK
jgi:hypothetical protein